MGFISVCDRNSSCWRSNLILRFFAWGKGTPLLANLTGDRHYITAEGWIFTKNLWASLLGKFHVAIELLTAALLTGILTGIFILVFTCSLSGTRRVKRVRHSILGYLFFIRLKVGELSYGKPASF